MTCEEYLASIDANRIGLRYRVAFMATKNWVAGWTTETLEQAEKSVELHTKDHPTHHFYRIFKDNGLVKQRQVNIKA